MVPLLYCMCYSVTIGSLQHLVRFQCGDIDGSARTSSVRLNETTECVGNSVLTVPHGVPDESEIYVTRDHQRTRRISSPVDPLGRTISS
jgi:hypothetical protein